MCHEDCAMWMCPFRKSCVAAMWASQMQVEIPSHPKISDKKTNLFWRNADSLIHKFNFPESGFFFCYSNANKRKPLCRAGIMILVTTRANGKCKKEKKAVCLIFFVENVKWKWFWHIHYRVVILSIMKWKAEMSAICFSDTNIAHWVEWNPRV